MKWEAIECQIFTTVGPAFRAKIAEDAKQKGCCDDGIEFWRGI